MRLHANNESYVQTKLQTSLESAILHEYNYLYEISWTPWGVYAIESQYPQYTHAKIDV